ncbi:MAG TPA: hypothetical protein VNW71_00185 [Thermoanaerobaculia bacterium]|nr:hypothetical protein [Thermoanaerobaculia bacterium]
MRADLLMGASLLLLVAVPAAGQPTTIPVENAEAAWTLTDPRILILFEKEVPESLRAQVLDAGNYEISLSAPESTGDVVPAIEATTLDIVEVTFGRDHTVVELHVEDIDYGHGTVEIREMASADARIDAASPEWSFSEPVDLQPTLSHNQSLRFQGKTAVIDFSFAYGGLNWNKVGDASRFTMTLEGSAPLGTPEDVDEEAGAEEDASEEVADFFKLSLLRTSFSEKGTLSSYGLMARSTSEFEGLEAVLTYQFAWLFGGTEVEQIERSVDLQGTVFAGASLEAGYRQGDAEWMSLTQPAPDRGDIVARVGGVLEWGPKLGPINRDLGAGLRFFIRGRGWADWAKDETGEEDVRFRGFLDSELFYNVSDEFRLFLRYENGYLPPDLSQRHSSTFVGVGTAF